MCRGSCYTIHVRPTRTMTGLQDRRHAACPSRISQRTGGLVTAGGGRRMMHRPATPPGRTAPVAADRCRRDINERSSAPQPARQARGSRASRCARDNDRLRAPECARRRHGSDVPPTPYRRPGADHRGRARSRLICARPFPVTDTAGTGSVNGGSGCTQHLTAPLGNSCSTRPTVRFSSATA